MIDKLKTLTNHKLEVVKGIENSNGRFITFKTTNPRQAAYDLCKAAKTHFSGNVSNVSQGTYYHFQITSKRPGFVAPGCLYETSAFGNVTEIYFRQGA